MIEIAKNAEVAGSNQKSWNVSRDGKPFGQIWTFSSPGEKHPYHFHTLTNHYKTFETFKEARSYAEYLAG